MPRILIDLENEEVKEVLNRTKKNLKEGIEAIVRDFLNRGRSLGDLSGSDKFRRLLDEILDTHFRRFLKEMSKGMAVEGNKGIDKDKVESIVKEMLEEMAEEIKEEVGEELGEKFKKLQNGIIREIDKTKSIVGRDIESITNIVQKLEKEIDKEILKKLKEIEEVSKNLEEKQGMITRLFVDSVLTKLGEIEREIKTLKESHQRLANFVGYKDLSCVGIHYKGGENEE